MTNYKGIPRTNVFMISGGGGINKKKNKKLIYKKTAEGLRRRPGLCGEPERPLQAAPRTAVRP